MKLETIRCPIIGTHVARDTDLEGRVSTVICPYYVPATGGCRQRATVSSGGPLARLLERVFEETLDDASTRCVVARS